MPAAWLSVALKASKRINTKSLTVGLVILMSLLKTLKNIPQEKERVKLACNKSE